ncbi:MAG TPA: acyltransferase, partial [Algoriphagus sp.]|nr:acyltransferase [Algoriphagus sp.]
MDVSDKKVKVGLVQLSCSGDVTENMNKTIKGVREAAQKGAE